MFMCIFVLVLESNIIDIIGHDREVLNGDATGEGCNIFIVFIWLTYVIIFYFVFLSCRISCALNISCLLQHARTHTRCQVIWMVLVCSLVGASERHHHRKCHCRNYSRSNLHTIDLVNFHYPELRT